MDGPAVIDGVLQLELPPSDAAFAADRWPSALVVGPENSLLAPVIESWLGDEPAPGAASLFNPLVLVGPAGSGKSHLAQAVVRHWRRQLQPHEIGYFTAADYGREYQAAQADQRLGEWRAGVRGLRLLVVEDLERLRPNATIQHDLRACLDALTETDAMVLITAEREPAALNRLDWALRDRLAAGLTVRLQRPGLAARRVLLQLAAQSRGMLLSTEQLARLARREAGTVAEVLGRLAAFDHRPTGEEREDSSAAAAREHVRMKQILAVTARYFSITQAALTGPSRRTSLVQARNIAVHLARRLTGLSYADIGRSLGGRDHTTIMHADRRLAERLARDPATQQTIEELDRLLR